MICNVVYRSWVLLLLVLPTAAALVLQGRVHLRNASLTLRFIQFIIMYQLPGSCCNIPESTVVLSM